MTNFRPLPMNADDPLVYTVPEAAQLLRISRAFAYELVARGELPVIRLGRRVVVPKVRLLALIEPPVMGEEI
jgi:excisionase family DNA binding protein